MANQTARIEWRGGQTPVSSRFDDPYYSLTDGLAETRYVFLAGNDLPARFAPGFHIAELGFGTGLNVLSAWDMWRDSGVDGSLNFTSFEQYPLATLNMEKALSAFAELTGLANQFLAQWPPVNNRMALPGLNLHIIPGDANTTLPNWSGTADAWFLDGFSPAKNPQLWGVSLMQQVAAHTRADGTFATYTAAGHVRRVLSGAGFSVRRTAGFGRKRHMTIGQLAPAN